MAEPNPMVRVHIVVSSARCDMCSSNSLLLNTKEDSEFYLCKFHNEKLIEAVKADGDLSLEITEV